MQQSLNRFGNWDAHKPESDLKRATMQATLATLIAMSAVLQGCPKKVRGSNQEKHSGVVESEEEVAHDNWYYDENGKLVFRQLIAEELCDDGNSHVNWWRMNKESKLTPIKDHARGGYTSIFHDGDTLRKVRFNHLRQTWTQTDMELIDRKNRPKSARKGLPKKK